MLSILPITNERVIMLFVIAAVLAVLSFLFNAYIDKEADVDPLASNSAVYTVLGSAYTLLGALFALSIFFDWLTALFVIGVVLGCFAVSGTPMIFGDMRRGSRRRRAELKKATHTEDLED